MSEKLFSAGSFTVGCNYWASHAGTAMWSDWDENVVQEDFRCLSAAGLQLARIFPLWPDFQPLKMHYSCHGVPTELRMAETPLPDTPAGRAGVSEEAMTKFRTLADIAAENGIRLSVGLITGWMSGRMFMPPAFERLNALTNPLVKKWQVRFVRYFVREFKDHPAIAAWGPGNECNCMAPVESREEAWEWMNTICSAIRLEDPHHPVISGMHSLQPGSDTFISPVKWSIEDQGELSDVLTTHPYPKFTPYASLDPINRIKNCFHAAAESRYYGDIGGKPCVAEELGTLSAMLAGETVKTGYIRNALFNLWSHDCRALIWWCAFDQLHLTATPYDWTAYERELGLVKEGYEPKPVLAELSRFRKFIDGLPFKHLPRFRSEAICLLSDSQESWPNAWGSFLLAKQAGFDLEFRYAKDAFPESDFYIVPGICDAGSMTRATWFRLIDRVKAGATLYLSLDNGLLAPFNDVFGVEAQYQEDYKGKLEFTFEGNRFEVAIDSFQSVVAQAAEVLAQDGQGRPVFTRCKLGQGEVFLFLAPIEKYLITSHGGFHADNAAPFHSIYRCAARKHLSGRLVSMDNPMVTATEHSFGESETLIVAVNNQPEEAETALCLAEGWHVADTLYGTLPRDNALKLSGNDAAVFTLKKKT
jgi:hypothetical protein